MRSGSLAAEAPRDVAVADLERFLERVDDPPVVMAAGVQSKLAERLSRRPAPRVDAIRRHRAVGVADRDDPSLDRDRITGEPVGIAGSVDALVVVADRGGGHADRADA